jgi:ABC-2 type transport system permease protein
MIRIFKTLIRISSFLGKEMTEIFRQPRLILTLVLGPFLIMFLFGLGFPDQNRTLRTTFVTTDPATFQKEMNIFTKSFNSKIFDYVIESDKEKALTKLALNQTDLVIVVPDVPFETIKSNQQAEFLVYHNEVDPIQIAYIQSVARILVDEVNRQVLQSMAKQGQADSGSLQTDLETAIAKTQALRQAIPPGDVTTATQAADLEKDLTKVHENLTTFRSLAPGILVSPFSAKIT